MTIREAIEDLLARRGPDTDPAAVLEGHGFDDLPADALSSALVHFAERSSMEVADALAPVVTRLSSVPFSEGDLPDSDAANAILAEGGDVFDLLGQLDLSGADLDGPDPSDFDLDDLDDLVDQAEAIGVSSESTEDVTGRLADTFGRGDDGERPAADDADPSELDDALSILGDVERVDEVTPPEEELTEVGEGLLGELSDALSAATDDDPATDDDLDFDLD